MKVIVLSRFDHYLTKPLRYCVDYGWVDNDMFHSAVTDATAVTELVRKFCETHPSALFGGSEWLQQADGQTKADAIRLVGEILDQLAWYGK